MRGERAVGAALFAVLLLTCGQSETTLVAVEQTPLGSGVRLALVAVPGTRINALLKPVLERPDGTVLRFDAPGRSADSAYFISAPTLELSGPAEGLVRASVCARGEQVCRSVVLRVTR